MGGYLRLLIATGATAMAISCGVRLADNEIVPVRSVSPFGPDSIALVADSTAALLVVLRSGQLNSPLVESTVELTPRNRPARSVLPTAHRVGRDSTTQFDGLDPGSYRLRAASIGYKPVVLRVDLIAGCRTRVDVVMAVEWICETPEDRCPVTTPRASVLGCKKAG
jgi:hypothetical protein